MNPLVSIIIPVHNARATLDHCLGSLARQTYANIELLLVDDASTDDSGTICAFWATREPRIQVLTQSTNQGVSAARNRGLTTATGKFVCFVDSDDWCEPTYIERFVDNMTTHQVAMACGGYFADGGFIKAITNDPLARQLSQEELLTDIIKPSGDIRGFLWNKCYSLNVINAHHLRFDTELAMMEDQLFNVQYATTIDGAWYDSTQTYHYVTYSDSASHALSAKKLTNEFAALDKIDAALQTTGLTATPFHPEQ
ncbi:glycosyltransferase family 2 protein [Furfurilactobacillus sp. WILCCON 0119]